jgi:hypothetical protein
MRKTRVKDLLQKYENLVKGGVNPKTVQISKESEEDGRFMSKYFDLVSDKQFSQFFGQYT